MVSDEGQTEACGPDICSVASALLPVPSIQVGRIGVDAESIDSDRLGCISGAQSASASADLYISKYLYTELIDAAASSHSRPTDWDSEGWWERWLWLIIAIIATLSALSYGFRHGWRAHDYEKTSEEIQKLERQILTKDGDANSHRDAIANASKFEVSELRGLLWAGRILAGLFIISVSVLLFCDEKCFCVALDEEDTILWGIELDSARRLAWMVLSSNFANAFAVLGVTPIFFAFAQNWRFVQSKKTFGIVSGSAAAEEARREQSKLNSLYQELSNVWTSVLSTQIDSSWARPVLRAFKSARRYEAYTETDTSNLSIAIQKLLLLAQGEAPVREGATIETVKAKIAELKSITTRPLFKGAWGLDELINELSKRNALGSQASLWVGLSEAVSKSNAAKIKSILAEIAKT